MQIKIMDGKKELTFQINSRWQDGTPIDFDNADHTKQFKETIIRGIESVGYKYEGDRVTRGAG